MSDLNKISQLDQQQIEYFTRLFHTDELLNRVKGMEMELTNSIKPGTITS
jgi:hypothetical protein